MKHILNITKIILLSSLILSCNADYDSVLLERLALEQEFPGSVIDLEPYEDNRVAAVTGALVDSGAGSLALWLRADSIEQSDLAIFSNGSEPEVNVWRDMSGRTLSAPYSLDASSNSDSSRPEFHESVPGLNSQPAIYFDGSDELTILAGIRSSTINYIYNDEDKTTIYMVVLPETVNSDASKYTGIINAGSEHLASNYTYTWPAVYIKEGRLRVQGFYKYYESEANKIVAGTPYIFTLEKDFSPYQDFRDYLIENQDYNDSSNYAINSSGGISAKLPIYENDFFSFYDNSKGYGYRNGATYTEDENGLTKMNMLNVKINDELILNDNKMNNTSTGIYEKDQAIGGGIDRENITGTSSSVMFGSRDVVYCLYLAYYDTGTPVDYYNTFYFQEGYTKDIRSMNQLRLGDSRYSSSSNADNFTGHIAEVIIFNGKLSTEQNHEVSGYLSEKYNIAIPASGN